jgi:hypothetical protein
MTSGRSDSHARSAESGSAAGRLGRDRLMLMVSARHRGARRGGRTLLAQRHQPHALVCRDFFFHASSTQVTRPLRRTPIMPHDADDEMP